MDLDNTITDRRRSVAAVARQLRHDFERRLLPSPLQEIVRIVADVDGDGYHTRAEIASGLRELLPWSDPPSSEELFAYWCRTFPMCTQPRSGLYPFLVGLKTSGLRLAIVSNGGTHAQLAKIRRIGILPYFDKILISEALGVVKPDPEIFRLALEELEVAPSAAWFLGDHPLVDVLGAQRAGMTAVWLEGCHVWPGSCSDPAIRVRGLHEFIRLIEASA